MATPFRSKANLPKLPEGSERALIEQFRAIQNRLDGLDKRQARLIPPVFAGLSCAATVGMLLRVSPPETTGTFVMLPEARSENISERIMIAVVAGYLSPGVTLSVTGRKGSINGQQVVSINNYRLVELVSCGEFGWFFST